MLIPMLPPICLFTGKQRVKQPARNPNKPPRKDKRGTQAYLDETEDGRRVQRDRGAAAREAREAAEREKAAAAFLEMRGKRRQGLTT